MFFMLSIYVFFYGIKLLKWLIATTVAALKNFTLRKVIFQKFRVFEIFVTEATLFLYRMINSKMDMQIAEFESHFKYMHSFFLLNLHLGPNLHGFGCLLLQSMSLQSRSSQTLSLCLFSHFYFFTVSSVIKITFFRCFLFYYFLLLRFLRRHC